MLWDRADFGQYCHVVVIVLPARHDMVVEMVINSGAGNMSQIQTDIETVGTEFLFQNPGCLLNQVVYCREFRRLQFGDAGNMPHRGDEQVSVRVRVAIEQAESFVVPIKQEQLSGVGLISYAAPISPTSTVG